MVRTGVLEKSWSEHVHGLGDGGVKLGEGGNRSETASNLNMKGSTEMIISFP